MHLGDSLMKDMIHTTQEVFSKRNAFTTSQMGSHYNVIQSGFIGFTTEINLHNHMFRNALYSTSPRGPSFM
jgi:hypothetical protein